MSMLLPRFHHNLLKSYSILIFHELRIILVVIGTLFSSFTISASSFTIAGVSVVSSTPKQLILDYSPQVDITSKNNELSIRVAGCVSQNTISNTEQIVHLPFIVPSENGWKLHTAIDLENRKILQGRLVKQTQEISSTFDSNRINPSLLESQQIQHVDKSQQRDIDAEYTGMSGFYHTARIIIRPFKEETYIDSLGNIATRVSIITTIRIVIDFDLSTLPTGSIVHASRVPATFNSLVATTWSRQESTSFNNKRNNLQTTTVSSSAQWARIPIEREGVYTITAEQLRQAGINVSQSEIPTIRFYNNGGIPLNEMVEPALINQDILREQPIIVNRNQSGDLASITFYGAPAFGWKWNSSQNRFDHWLNPFTTKNYYYISIGDGVGLRAVPVTNPSGNISSTRSISNMYVFQEEELESTYISGSGTNWFGRKIDQSFPQTFVTQLTNLARNEGPIRYTGVVAQRNPSDSGNTTFTFTENGLQLGTIRIPRYFKVNYLDAYAQQFTFSQNAQAISSDNRSSFRIAYKNPAAPSANSLLDYFEISYPAQHLAVDGTFSLFVDTLRSGITAYQINGFSGTTYGFNVTNPAQPELLTNASTTGGIYTVLHDSAQGFRRYLISSNTMTATIEKVDFGTLLSENYNTNMILLTPPEFLNSANEYKKYRESVSPDIRISIIQTTHINHSFGYGTPDHSAIRNFLYYAMQNWTVKPEYVLFWGDGHFDFRNITTKQSNWIGSWQSSVDSKTGFFIATDEDPSGAFAREDYFACVNGRDDIPDIALGRLPINTDAQGLVVLNKIKMYEQSSSHDAWRMQYTFVADDGVGSDFPEGALHTGQSESLANNPNSTPNDIFQKKIYLSDYPTEGTTRGVGAKPLVTADILNTTNTRGSVLLNWVGHGNPNVWAHETVFSKDVTIPQMTNSNKLFFLVAATCDFARNDMADRQSGAEELVVSPIGGAIGVFSANRIVYSGQNAALATVLFENFESRDEEGRYLRLGDIIRNVKEQRSGSNGKTQVNDQKYYLLGDPTIRLVLPDNRVEFTTINGVSTDSVTSITLKALSEVTIKGRILDRKGESKLQDYNGYISITLLDSYQQTKVIDPRDSATHFIRKQGNALHRGSYQVVNGEFTATFIIPKDIAFNDNPASLLAMSLSTDSNATRFGRGAISGFKLNGIVESSIRDNDGPSVEIYLDSRKFKDYDVVRPTPTLIVDLIDETGINTTGIGIGHNIEAWIDDDITSVNLTDDFTTSLTDSRSGSVSRQLFSLQPGTHKIRVRAWDVLNNFSDATAYFTISESGKGIISNRLEVFPNPMNDKVTILFTHNQAKVFSAELQIYDLRGVKMYSTTQNIEQLQATSFTWDGRSQDGIPIAQGVYPFVILLTASDGSTNVMNGLISLIR